MEYNLLLILQISSMNLHLQILPELVSVYWLFPLEGAGCDAFLPCQIPQLPAASSPRLLRDPQAGLLSFEPRPCFVPHLAQLGLSSHHSTEDPERNVLTCQSCAFVGLVHHVTPGVRSFPSGLLTKACGPWVRECQHASYAAEFIRPGTGGLGGFFRLHHLPLPNMRS